MSNSDKENYIEIDEVFNLTHNVKTENIQISAKGRLIKNGKFIVSKGGQITPKLQPSANNTLKKDREKHKDKINEKNVLMEDIVFSSPSRAASFICGSPKNGNEKWYTANGLNLGKLLKISNSSQSTNTNLEEFPLFEFKHKNLKAFGTIRENKFIVLKGSQISQKLADSARNKTEKLREKYKYLIQNDVLTEDLSFNSPSEAAQFVGGYSISGNVAWKTKDNKSPKDLGFSKKP